jgi:hypothetical protein
MVVCPNKPVCVFGYSKNREAHQRGLGVVEAALAIRAKISSQPLFLFMRRHLTKIQTLNWQFQPPKHHLHRLVKVFPNERGAKYGMPVNDSLPRAFERIGV